MKVYVNYEDNRWKKYKIDFAAIANAAGPKNPDAEVSITLVDDATIHRLNKEYRDMDKPTNVLSFELGDDMLLGDIYISLDTVAREAAAAKISVAEHTAHMVVHGMLHLQGYDHIKDDEAVVMESREIDILKGMGIKNPYADEASVSRPRRGRAWLRAGALAIFGGLAALGFAPFHLWPITVVAIAAGYWILTDMPRASVVRCFLRAAPFGAAYSVAMFWWALSSIYVVPELARQFAIWTIPGLIGLGLAGAVVFAVPFVAAMRMRGAARIFVFAGAWTFVLWAREWMFTGFPWNPIANIMLQMPVVANSMALFGAIGLTFIICGLIACAIEIIRNKKCAMCWISGVFFVVMLGAGMLYGRHNIYIANQMPDTYLPLIRVVQPATSQDQKMSYSRADALARAERNVRNLLAMGAEGGGDVRPDLIVYPETTYPFVITDSDMPFSKMLGTNVILGASSYRDGSMYNSMVVSGPDGNVVQVYDKAHLVPFGEYGPLGIMPAPVNLAHGDGPMAIDVALNGNDFLFVPAICYEIIFSDSLIPGGINPNAIINITNDTWFGTTPGTYQHLDMVRRYAIESGVPVIRANYSGVSAFISSDGWIVSQIPVGVAGVLDGHVSGAHMTMYRRMGRDWWVVILLVVACAGAVVTSRRRN